VQCIKFTNDLRGVNGHEVYTYTFPCSIQKDEADALLLQDNSVTLDPRDETDTTKPKGKRNKTKLKHKPETTEPKGETDTVKPKEETDLSKSTDETDTSNIRFEIDLTDDDKVAVQLTVEYLYFLDYARPKPVRIKFYIMSMKIRKKRRKQKRAGYLIRGEAPPVVRVPIWKPAANSLQDVELETHAKVYMHAAKYQIEQLKVMALAKFIKAAEVTADKPWNADGFVSATKTVYDGPGADAELHKGLRSAVITILLAHKELFQQDNMKKVMEGDHQLCYDLIMRLVGCESE